MIDSAPEDEDSDCGLVSLIDRIRLIGSAFGLVVLCGCGLIPPEPVTAASEVTAPADEVTIEILAPHADYTSLIRLDSHSTDVELTNYDIGETWDIEVTSGEEIVFEIQPILEGSPVAGPWHSGSASRNSDGEVHALLTTLENSRCLLVSFEDEDAEDWGDHPDEPDYTDVLVWVYPTVSPRYDTSQCPRGPAEIPEE